MAGGLALGVSLVGGGLSLGGFGLNAIIDLSASVVLVWRFWKDADDPEAAAALERRAELAIAAAMLGVATYLTAQASPLARNNITPADVGHRPWRHGRLARPAPLVGARQVAGRSTSSQPRTAGRRDPHGRLGDPRRTNARCPARKRHRQLVVGRRGRGACDRRRPAHRGHAGRKRNSQGSADRLDGDRNQRREPGAPKVAANTAAALHE